MKSCCHTIFFSILLFSLSLYGLRSSSESAPQDPVQIALEQIQSTSSKLQQVHQIIPIGEGMRGKFLGLDISFQIRRQMSKEEARRLLLICAQEFMDDINSNEELRPYLKEYPFTFANVGIRFYLRDSNGRDLYHHDICVAACTSDGLYFSAKDPEVKYNYTETSEETNE